MSTGIKLFILRRNGTNEEYHSYKWWQSKTKAKKARDKHNKENNDKVHVSFGPDHWRYRG